MIDPTDALKINGYLDQIDAMSNALRLLVKTIQAPPPDTTPPSNPTSLAVALASNAPSLTWTASTDNVKVVGYQVWRKTGSGGTYAQLALSPVNSYLDTAAPSGSTYFYKVAAYDSATPPNVSGFSNEVSQAVSSSDVTAPAVPAQPAVATITNTTNPPTYSTNWPSVSDIDPADGSPVTGTKQYLVYHDYPAANTLQGTVSQPVAVGSPTSTVIGVNSGGSLVTGSDNGSTISSTSTTGDNNAQQWGTKDEFFLSSAVVQRGSGYVVIQLTSATNPAGYDWSKRGVELRQNLSAGSPFVNMLYFGAVQGLKGEQRLAASGQATGGSQVANPGLPLWLKISWDSFWTVTRSYSTNSTNGVDGTWTTYDTIALAWVGDTAYAGKFADASTVGTTGGTVSSNYSNFSVTNTASIVWNGTGVAGQTINVTAKSQDNAGNTSAASTARSMTFGSAAAVGFPITGLWNAQLTTNTAYLQALGKYNFISWVAWLIQQGSISAAANMQSVKNYASAAGNPLCKTLQYNIFNEWFSTTGDAGFFDNARLSVLNANPYWWLVSNYPGTNKVTSQDGLPRKTINNSNTPPTTNLTSVGSVTGPGVVNAAQFQAWLSYQQYVLGNTHSLNASDPVIAANPYLDGFIYDNQEITPYTSGCWGTTSTSFSCTAGTFNATVAPWVAGGYKQSIDMVRSLYPTTPSGSTFIMGGNCDGYNYGAGATYNSALLGLYDLPMSEQPFGNFEAFNGSNYNNLLSGLAAFEVVLKSGTNNYVLGLIEAPARNVTWTSTNQANWTATDWRAFRYQAGNFALMRWCIMIDLGAAGGNVWTFDELTGGTLNTLQWLGAPSGSRSLVHWLAQGTYGLFKADFANGSVIINPKGNGVQTFNMPFTGHFLATTGKGDAAYNTGAAFTTATTLTLQDRDAIFVRNT